MNVFFYCPQDKTVRDSQKNIWRIELNFVLFSYSCTPF